MRQPGLGLWVVLICAATARAAEVEPAWVQKTVTSGKQDSFKITLRTDQEIEKVWVQPVDFSIDRKGNISTADVPGKIYSGKRWCRLRPTEVTLRKGKDVQLEIPVSVPGGTPAGEYHFGLQVYVPMDEGRVGENVSMKVTFNFIVLVLLDVKGGSPKYGAQIIEPAVEVQNAIPQFRATFKSLSTASLISHMFAVIRDADKKVYDKVMLKSAGSLQPDGQAFLLPEELRDFSGEGNRRLPAGKYHAELIAVYAGKLRVSKTIPFEILGSQIARTSPIDDIAVSPPKIVLELPAAGSTYQNIEIKNRGLNAVELALSASAGGVSFFPETVLIEPGKTARIRVGIRLPRGEDPRRDLTLRIGLKDGGEKDVRLLNVSVYAPGMAPREDPEKPDVHPSRPDPTKADARPPEPPRNDGHDHGKNRDHDHR